MLSCRRSPTLPSLRCLKVRCSLAEAVSRKQSRPHKVGAACVPRSALTVAEQKKVLRAAKQSLAALASAFGGGAFPRSPLPHRRRFCSALRLPGCCALLRFSPCRYAPPLRRSAPFPAPCGASVRCGASSLPPPWALGRGVGVGGGSPLRRFPAFAPPLSALSPPCSGGGSRAAVPSVGRLAALWGSLFAPSAPLRRLGAARGGRRGAGRGLSLARAPLRLRSLFCVGFCAVLLSVPSFCRPSLPCVGFAAYKMFFLADTKTAPPALTQRAGGSSPARKNRAFLPPPQGRRSC